MNIKIKIGKGHTAWHIDKSFDEVIKNENKYISPDYSHSFIFTLKGLPTIFLPTNEEVRNEFYSISKEYEFTHEPNNIENITNYTNTVEAKSAVFMRSSKYGSIHTAPDGEDRVVFVISPLLEETVPLLNEYFMDQNRL